MKSPQTSEAVAETCRGLVMDSPTATKKKGYIRKTDSPFSLWVTRPKYYFYTLIETA